MFKYRRVQRLRLPIVLLKIWQFDNTISEFWAYCFNAHAQKRLFTSFQSKICPPLFAPTTPISCNRGIPLCRNTFSLCFDDFFSAHAQK